MIVVKIVNDFAKDLRDFIERTAKAGLGALEETAKDAQEFMRVEGKPINPSGTKSAYVNWDSIKQRNYVMAKLRKEGNLPYKRTGAYQAGWKTRNIKDGTALVNFHPAGAVGGLYEGWQSNITKGNWNSLTIGVKQALTRLVDRVIERMK